MTDQETALLITPETKIGEGKAVSRRS